MFRDEKFLPKIKHTWNPRKLGVPNLYWSNDSSSVYVKARTARESWPISCLLRSCHCSSCCLWAILIPKMWCINCLEFWASLHLMWKAFILLNLQQLFLHTDETKSTELFMYPRNKECIPKIGFLGSFDWWFSTSNKCHNHFWKHLIFQ